MKPLSAGIIRPLLELLIWCLTWASLQRRETSTPARWSTPRWTDLWPEHGVSCYTWIWFGLVSVLTPRVFLWMCSSSWSHSVFLWIAFSAADVQVALPGVGPSVFCGVGLAGGLMGLVVGIFFIVKGNTCNWESDCKYERKPTVWSTFELTSWFVLHALCVIYVYVNIVLQSPV